MTELQSPPSVVRAFARALLPRKEGTELPDEELVLRDVHVDDRHVAAYSRVCGFAIRDTLPVTYPHVLAFPLAVELMTSRAFPFRLPGIVHVGNRISQHAPLRRSDRPDIRVRLANLRPHPRGRQFDVVADVSVGSATTWSDTSTYLIRGDGAEDDRPPSEPPSPPAPSAQWDVPADIGRRYAAVSGDRNPIHLHRLPARALGFPRAIAHGMWTKARCVAALQPQLPDAFEVAVEFRKPVLLPSRVGFGAEWREGRVAFAVTSTERLHVLGEARW